MVAEGEMVEAIAVLNGKIVFTGTTEDARALDGKKVVDLEGKTVIPGFTDTHLHLMMDCEERLKVNLLNASSIDEVIALMKEKADMEPQEIGCLLGG